jgi:hypothetical protein
VAPNPDLNARSAWTWLTASHDPFFGWPVLSWLCWAVCIGTLAGMVLGLRDVG